jgi:hypothetical protein
MDDKRIRPGVWAAVLGLMTLVVVLVFLLQSRQPPRPPEQKPPAQEEPLASAPTGDQPGSRSRDIKITSRPAPPAAQEAPAYIEGLVWGDIDLREAKELMPDNLYWQLGSPTKDPAVLEAREQEKNRRNEEYGKVLAGDASEDDVRAYYDYRKRVSSDYLEFAEFMNRRFRNSLSDEFKGLLDLSMQMHSSRLQQIPADLAEALERAREHARIRDEWQKEQKEFDDAPTEPGGNR